MSDANAMERFVKIGRLGEVAAGEDVLVVEPGVPERRVMRRLWANVGARRRVLEELHEKQARSPRVLEVGTDAEKRVCVILEDAPRMPAVLARPRSTAEDALIAHDVLQLMIEARPRPYVRGMIDAAHIYLDLHGVVGLRSLWPPRVSPEGYNATQFGEEALVIDVVGLVQRRGVALPLAQRTVRHLEDALRRRVPHLRPERWSPPLIADARRLLDVLTDADRPEDARVEAALRLALVPSLVEETGALLVRALNEPLVRLPFVARELLADRMVPMPLFVGGNGMLRRCPHEWARAEIVEELGGASVERYCADCDARVTLPQTIETFAGRSAVADMFARY